MKKANKVLPALLLLLLLSGCTIQNPQAPEPQVKEPPIETPEEPDEKEPPVEDPLPQVEPEIKEEPEEEAVVEPEPEPEEELIYTPYSATLWTTAHLNLREAPDKESPIIMEIVHGDSVHTSSKISNGWYKVLYKGKEGYASGKYLTEEQDKPVDTGYAPYRIHIMDRIIVYENTNPEDAQTVIDTNRGMASTWGEVPRWSPDDRKNTYFIGHSDAAFEGIWQSPMGSEIIVTDEFGNPTTYVLEEIYTVDDYAVGIYDGINYFDYLVGAGDREMITLQTCKTDDTNYILRAYLKKDE